MSVVAAAPTWETRVRSRVATTPGWLRLASLVAAALVVIGAVAATTSAAQMRSATRHAVRTSGPVLVASQQVVSSLAAADAAATAAFLSGRDEDPEQRRLFEQALAQATTQTSDIASLAGNDDAIRGRVQTLSVALTRYAGLVETARAQNRLNDPGATASLTTAIQFASALVGGEVRGLNQAAQASFERDVSHRGQGYAVALLIVLLALTVVVLAQLDLVRRTRRVLNLPLVLTTVLALIALVSLTGANSASRDAMKIARHDGYDSIVITTNLASAGFTSKADETLALIANSGESRANADASAQQVTQTLSGATRTADSPRERAAVAEVAARWQRYQATVATLRAAPAPQAKTIATGPASADFNGFNFSIEAVLGQNRDEFLHGLSVAASDTNHVPQTLLALLLVAALAALAGFQLRINEYR